MKTSMMYFMSAVAFLALAWACQKEPVSSGEPTVTLSSETLNVPAAGGEYKIGYQITNPVQDAEIVLSDIPSWMSADVVSDDEICVVVAGCDDTEPRTAEINGSYADVTFKITIVQDAASSMFGVSVDQALESSLSVTVTPIDSELTYLCLCVEKTRFEAYGSEDEYLSNVMENIRAEAEMKGDVFKEYLKSISHSGVQEGITFSRLVPNRTYLINCIGVDPANEKFVTNLYKFDVKTKEIPMADVVFDLEPKTISNTLIDLHVSPSDGEIYYLNGSVSGQETVDPEDVIVPFQEAVYSYFDMVSMMGWSTEETVKTLCYKGEQVIENALVENTVYHLFVAAIDMNGYVNSIPQMVKVTTGEFEMSDNVITIEMYEVLDYSATYVLHPSNDDPFASTIGNAEWFAGMSEEEIEEELFSGKYSWPQYPRRGKDTVTMELLDPETEYYVFAYGYDGASDRRTTKLFMKKFKTSAPIYGEASFDMVYDKYFDGDALLEQYPDLFAGYDVAGKAVLPATVELSGDVDKYYYCLFSYDTSDIIDRTLDATLKREGKSDPTVYFVISYDKVHSIAGNAFDKDGWPGKTFRDDGFILTKDGASDVAEFTPFASGTSLSRASEMQMLIDKTSESLMVSLAR